MAASGDSADAPARVLGRTCFAALLVLAVAHTTGQLARRLHASDATASEHAGSLRAAGLVNTVRDGRAALHCRTALGTLPVQRHEPDAGTAAGTGKGAGTSAGTGK